MFLDKRPLCWRLMCIISASMNECRFVLTVILQLYSGLFRKERDDEIEMI